MSPVLMSQQTQSVILNPGYSHQSYFSLDNGEVANVDNSNWDIAFSTGGMGSAIRINGATGLQLFTYPNGGISDWSSVDSTGMSTWSPQYNSDKYWSLGAFDQSADPDEAFDLGWGIYSMITHFITGDSLHLLKWSDGSVKKFQIIDLASGVYSFRYANLDGSNEVESSISKTDFEGKNFAYYSILNNEELDREPVSVDWDIVFTKYVTELYPGTHYGVTGVLSNLGYSVAKVSGVAVDDAEYTSGTFLEDINAIGFDWKSFNMTTYEYDLEESLSYFVRKDGTGEIWKIYFTAFEGSSTGYIEFMTEVVLSANVGGLDIAQTFKVYPNPCKERSVNLIYEIDSKEASAGGVVLDMNGQVVYNFALETGGLRNKILYLDHLNAGAYIVCYNSGSSILREKLILN